MSPGRTRKFTEEADADFIVTRGNEVTTTGAAKLLGVSSDTVCALQERGLLTASFVTPGGHRRFTKAAVDAFFATHERRMVEDALDE